MDAPVKSVYSSVATLRSIPMTTFLAELNQLELWGTDIGNVCLESYTSEKTCIVAGSEFGDQKGHVLIFNKALCESGTISLVNGHTKRDPIRDISTGPASDYVSDT